MDNQEPMQPVEEPAPVKVGRFGRIFSAASVERLTGRPLTRLEKVATIIMLVVFLFVFYVTLDANKYAAQVRVVEGEGKIGVNPTTEMLDFGDLSRGTATVRTVLVRNDTPLPFFVAVIKVGAIRDLVKQSDNNFMLRRGEQRKIEFNVFIPASAEIERVYSGRVFVFKIPAPFF